MYFKHMYPRKLYENMDPTVAAVIKTVGAVVFIPIYIISAVFFCAACVVIVDKIISEAFFTDSNQANAADYQEHNSKPMKCVGEDCSEETI